MDPYVIEIWRGAGGLRCVMQPHGAHWELALIRQRRAVKVDMFVDIASALAGADEWRRVLERASEERTLTPTSSTTAGSLSESSAFEHGTPRPSDASDR
jgi:hypothetical protein